MSNEFDSPSPGEQTPASSPNQPPAKSALPTMIVVVVAILAAGLWITMRPKASLTSATKNPAVGQPLMELALEPLTGGTESLSLANVRGKVTLINYWGPWCGFCRDEFPHLLELWDKDRDNPDFAFVSVSSGQDPREDVTELRKSTRQFLAARGATFPTYVDLSGATRSMITRLAGMQYFGYPTTVLLDRNGIIRGVWEGYEDGFDMQMDQMVSQLLKAKPTATEVAK
ncbi:MAG TPA: TlpA disulfide reductase family protein [Pirellulales bacterium]|jgi:thiol-disulfide isomerase/thioredoxin